MSNIVPFSFGSTDLRAVTDARGEPWFIASDVAEILGYRDAANMTRMLDDDEADTHIVRIRSENGVEQDREMTIISESGLYACILKSRRPEAGAFRKWVTAEVLPSIRKTGKYDAPAAAAKTEDPRIAALKLSSLAMQAARAFGFKGNHAALSADQAIKTLTGASPLALLGHAHLAADTRGQTYGLNELGQMLDPPVSGIVLGKKLAEAGLRAKDEVGNWVPTSAASGMFEWLDTAKRHNGGTPVKQVKWFRDVLQHVH